MRGWQLSGIVARLGKIGEFTRVGVVINTPAQVHLFKNLIRRLQEDGHQVLTLARNYGDTLELLSELGIASKEFHNGHGSKLSKAARTPIHLSRMYGLLREHQSDMILGVGADCACVSRLLGKPSILFNDSEPIPFQLLIMEALADAIITPSCFRKDLGRNHIRVESYKELAYLHPNNFRPDPSILDTMDIAAGDRFAVLRFNGFRAVHDLGISGFTIEDKRNLVHSLSKCMRVFISSETALPRDLQEFALRTPKAEIHHVIAQADMVVADTQTIVTESALLGTPAVRCNGFVGKEDMGNFVELEKRYGMVFSYREAKEAISKAIQLSDTPNLKKDWMNKRENLLRDKIDLTEYLFAFVNRYPDSLTTALGPSAD